MNSKVTIGVCVKNSEKTIRESIDSIIKQKYPAELLQVVVVDGSSKDNTMAIVARISAKSGIKFENYSDDGRGLSVARQIVVNKAIGKYIIFVDADVKLFNDFVSKHVGFMEENPNVGVAFGKPMYHDGTLVASVGNLVQYTTGGFSGNDATVYRIEALKIAGGFDLYIKGAGEDDDLVNRIRMHKWLARINEKARFFHKNRDNIRDFLAESSWFGYGTHYFSHKRRRYPNWRQNLFGTQRKGLRMASKAYALTHKKISFLIIPRLVLAKVAWWFGYYKAHMDGYGHEINE